MCFITVTLDSLPGQPKCLLSVERKKQMFDAFFVVGSVTEFRSCVIFVLLALEHI